MKSAKIFGLIFVMIIVFIFFACAKGMLITFYQDADGDGYGNPNRPVNAYSQPMGYVENSEDCDDTNGLIHPNALEWGCDTVDNDCDGETDEQEVVNFLDPNLEVVVREAIIKPTGDILNTELCALTELEGASYNISNLTGIEYCYLLELIYLPRNQITDISLLSGLTNLTELYLGDNQLTDISALSNLTQLTLLSLDYNQLNDISPLSRLTNLSYLSLAYNQIKDIYPLANLTNLFCIALSYNQITEISPLSGLTNLGVLDLTSNQVSDISTLSNLHELFELYLRNNLVTNLQTLLDNNEIGSGDYMDLWGNPLGPSTCDQISILLARGTYVDYDTCQ